MVEILGLIKMKPQIRTEVITMERYKRNLWRATKEDMEMREKQQMSKGRALELLCDRYWMEVLGYVPEIDE